MAKVKRNRRSRLRGRKTAGHGARKKWRGAGTRGGTGMAGTGKKAGQKLSLIMKTMPKYLGKKGFVRHSTAKKELKMINLGDIELRMPNFEKAKLVKETSEGTELNLKGYKVLGKGEVSQKLIVTAGGFSKSAKKKIETKGGKAL